MILNDKRPLGLYEAYVKLWIQRPTNDRFGLIKASEDLETILRDLERKGDPASDTCIYSSHILGISVIDTPQENERSHAS